MKLWNDVLSQWSHVNQSTLVSQYATVKTTENGFDRRQSEARGAQWHDAAEASLAAVKVQTNCAVGEASPA